MKKLILLSALCSVLAAPGQDRQTLDFSHNDLQLLKRVQIISDQSKTVTASVTNGFVTLNGHVKSEIERRSLEGSVGQIPGVKQIDNNLVVGPLKNANDSPSGK